MSPGAEHQAEGQCSFVSAALVGACGGNYSAMTAVVYSPDFPDTYATGRVCYWTIRVPGASHIHFSFTLFDIRDSADMVELLDGYTHHVLVRFNGRNRPPLSFNISLDFVILYFFSDRINQAQGFAVLYQGETSWPQHLGLLSHTEETWGPWAVLAGTTVSHEGQFCYLSSPNNSFHGDG